MSGTFNINAGHISWEGSCTHRKGAEGPLLWYQCLWGKLGNSWKAVFLPHWWLARHCWVTSPAVLLLNRKEEIRNVLQVGYFIMIVNFIKRDESSGCIFKNCWTHSSMFKSLLIALKVVKRLHHRCHFYPKPLLITHFSLWNLKYVALHSQLLVATSIVCKHDEFQLVVGPYPPFLGGIGPVHSPLYTIVWRALFLYTI